MSNNRFVLDLKAIYKHFGTDRAEHYEESLQKYDEYARETLANRYYKTIVLTGSAPTWMYARILEAVRDFCDVMMINTPATGDVIIFKR